MSTNHITNGTQFIRMELRVFQWIPIQRINRILCCGLGVPLNAAVAVVIIRSKQLWSSRNIYWLGVSLFNLLVDLESMIELALDFLLDSYQPIQLHQNSVCQVMSIFIGWPEGLLLTGLMLASWERYWALARRPSSHFTTVKASIWFLIIVFFGVTGLHTLPFWTGFLSMKCGLNDDQLAFTWFYHVALSIISLTIQSRLHFFIKSSIRHIPESIRLAEIHHGHFNQNGTDAAEMINESHRRFISLLELRSVQNSRMIVLPSCLVTLMLYITSLILAILHFRDLGDCLMISREFIILFHSIYIPIVFVIRNREFQLAANRFHRSKPSNPTEQFD